MSDINKAGSLTREALEHVGSLITIKGANECLGDLMYFEGKGTYDPGYGRVPVTKEEAEIHNKTLDAARIEGMDKNCEIGQGSFAYLIDNKVTTFLGTVIAENVAISGQKRKTVYFTRAGKRYSGRLPWGEMAGDAFNFRRVA